MKGKNIHFKNDFIGVNSISMNSEMKNCSDSILEKANSKYKQNTKTYPVISSSEKEYKKGKQIKTQISVEGS
jgi:hypothetical protein